MLTRENSPHSVCGIIGDPATKCKGIRQKQSSAGEVSSGIHPLERRPKGERFFLGTAARWTRRVA